MKFNRLFVLSAATLTAGLLLGAMLVNAKSSIASKSHRRGTDIYHKYLSKRMTYVVPETGEPPSDDSDRRHWPHGRVDLKQNKQGNANNQRAYLSVGRLDPDTSYMLLALIGDDTNYMHVADFDTNRRGTARVRFRDIGSSHGHGLGHEKYALPTPLNPVSDLRAIAVANVNTQLVLQADLTLPDRLHYLIKRNLDNDGVEPDAMGSMTLKATTRRSSFRLYASGLEPDAGYALALNDELSEETPSDGDGQIALTTWMVEPLHILDVHRLAIWNSESNSVLSATLAP